MYSANLEARKPSIAESRATHRAGLNPMTLLLTGLLAAAALHILFPGARIIAWPWTLFGLAPLVGGISLMVLGDRRFEAAGTPVSPRRDPVVLVERGVYALSRNPMYLGIVFLLLGAALLLGTLSPLLVAPLVGRILSLRFIRWEEAKLRATFGETYEAYAARTPRWMGFPRMSRRSRWTRAGWWTLAALCLLYAGFALATGAQELLYQLGVAGPGKERSVPSVFVVHALAGGVVLLAGPLQFSAWLRRKSLAVHRILGRLYALGVGVSSVAGIRAAVSFDVVLLARIQFVLVAVLWLGATALGVLRIRHGDLESHREWMTRSFALSLFFVTFSVWPAATAASGLPQQIAYPLGLLLAWALNLAAAEALNRRRRALRKEG